MIVSRRSVFALALVSPLAACHGPLSTVDTAGRDAEEIARLFWWMAASGLILWVAMVALTWYCARGPRVADPRSLAPLLIVGGGVVIPTVLLTALLAFGLPSLTRLVDPPLPGHLTIAVNGEQWWWRVRYETRNGAHVELANEIRLPIGQRIEVSLTSDNVIHSFWIPAISGKIDMIPGRTTHLSLEPTRTGTFRGTCAEYCGTSHALMAFPVVVLEQDAFEAWLAAESRPAQDPTTPQAVRGRELFSANGCGACHAVRGTAAVGTIGPDLTHVGTRTTLGAATLPNQTADMVDWIRDPQRTKPGVHMPAFDVLGSEQVDALAAYLIGLR